MCSLILSGHLYFPCRISIKMEYSEMNGLLIYNICEAIQQLVIVHCIHLEHTIEMMKWNMKEIYPITLLQL